MRTQSKVFQQDITPQQAFGILKQGDLRSRTLLVRKGKEMPKTKPSWTKFRIPMSRLTLDKVYALSPIVWEMKERKGKERNQHRGEMYDVKTGTLALD